MRAFRTGRACEEESMKGKWLDRLKHMKKEQWIVYLLLAALLLVIFLPVSRKEGGEKETQVSPAQTVGKEEETCESQTEEMEEKLESALARVEGVGDVEVVLSLESTNQKVVEKDVPSARSSQESSGGEESSSSSSASTEESTVYQTDSDGNETPYVVRENYPEIRGVLVVAEGGGDPVVVQQIQEAVMALFRVEAHKIKVMKMKS